MLITLSTTRRPATDLGFLLHKHPERMQTFDVAGGRAHVFYPEASDERCTVALLLEIDPIGLAQRGRDDAFSLGQYVNDRPYVASSMVATALGKVFRTALSGRCDARPEVAATPIPLDVHVPVVRGDGELIGRLFGPIGWQVEATPIEMPGWGASPYHELHLSGTLRLADALSHLYVLLPALDGGKHYWMADDEVDKLLRAGAEWLAAHPDRDLVSRRYLRRPRLVAAALARLAEADDLTVEEVEEVAEPPAEVEPRAPLAVLRRAAVVTALKDVRARSVADLGCGGGALLRDLVREPEFTRILGADVSAHALETAERRLHLDRMSDRAADRITLRQSALTYTDDALRGYDAAVLMEVVEHVDPPRLLALARAVFGHAAPGAVVVTTPNVEHNVRYETLPAGQLRHRDHRFEWTRAQFREWADAVAGEYGYTVAYRPVGDDDPEVGPPTQLALFTKAVAA
ncbi:3' terminal RNA ribose 2'-O-methyltransferase Hen1 [Pseudonocardia sp. CA-107938]|uniref:3' terminal RNA ribose 2'-O-methyltransferase Hen1 n=1 Tax=Pseudonocardia sp. CA-107938 TaxID=3240021 RepID=UPI003D8EAF03